MSFFKQLWNRESTAPLCTWATCVALVALFGFLAAVLVLAGREPTCGCGLDLWTWDPWSTKTSQLLGDPYSFSHVLHGVLFYWVLTIFRRKLPLRWRLLIAIAIEIAWEIFENSQFIIDRYRAGTASLDYYGDSVVNSIGDVLSTVLGFWIASRFSWKLSIAVFVALEVGMAFMIRDNLSLNIIMLIHPFDAIREWQIEGK